MSSLDGRVAIVTGSAQGIGAAIARELAGQGASVTVADLNGEAAGQVAGSLEKALAVQADVSRPEDAERIVRETVGRFGKVDVLVNNAAIVPFVPWDELDLAEWRRI